MIRPRNTGHIKRSANTLLCAALLVCLLLNSLTAHCQSASKNQENTAFHVHQLKNKPNAYSRVNFHHLNLKTVPQQLENCSSLKHLNLANNQLEALPPFIQQLRRLETLDLSGMPSLNATKLFDNIQGLSKLKTLNLSNGDFVILPYQVTALRNLEVLDLSENLFEDVPSFAMDLPKLKSLNLGNNKLKTLNYDIYKLQELTTIDLSHNPDLDYNDAIFTLSFLYNLKDVRLQGLKKFPEEINKLQQINQLDLSNGRFFNIPAKIGDLTSLNTLKLNNCDKLDLKDALAKFDGNSQLQALECINNKVYFFPKGLGKFSNLKSLVLGGPLLKFISPDFKKLNRLQALSIVNSPLIDVRDLTTRLASFKTFKSLSLKRCNFSVFPADIVQLLDLTALDLSGNQIKTIPMSIGRLKQLKRLNLEGNQISKDNLEQVQIMLPDCEIICSSILDDYPDPITDLFELEPQLFNFSAEDGDTIEVNERTSIVVPPNAFQTLDGTPVKGLAELSVIAITHPFDSWRLALPTVIDSASYKYNVHNAGQFQLAASQNGAQIQLIPGQEIALAFESTLDEREPLEILRYHQTSHTWGKHGWDEVTGKSNPDKNNPFGEGFVGIQRPKLPIAPIKPTVEELSVSFYTNKRQPFISIKGKYHDDLEARTLKNNEKAFSDLSEIEQIAWIYDGKDWKQDSRVMDTLMNINQQLNTAAKDRKILDDLCLSYGELSAKKAVDVMIEKRTGDNQFNLRFIRVQDTVNLPVISYEIPEGPFLNNYKTLRKQRQENWQRLDQNYLVKLDQYQQAVDEYREEISNYSEDMGPLGGFKDISSFKFKRIAKIGTLGNFIIGKVLFQDNNQLFTRYLDQNKNTVYPKSVIVIDETINNVVLNQNYKLSFDPKSKNSIITVFSNGAIGLVPSGLFRQLKKNNDKSITEIPLFILKKSEISEERINSILGL